MKRIVLLLTLLLPLMMTAQTKRMTTFEVRAGQGIELYSKPYYAYSELPRTTIMAQANIGCFLIGAGYDYITVNGAANESAVHLRTGVVFDFGKFSADTFITGEKIFQKESDMPILFGYGVSAAYKIVGPLCVYGEVRAQCPLFQERYVFYKTISTCLSIGLKIKF